LITTRNFLRGQGYETGPVVLYQDNMSAMALMQRSLRPSDPFYPMMSAMVLMLSWCMITGPTAMPCPTRKFRIHSTWLA
jgi:hypothetical protein